MLSHHCLADNMMLDIVNLQRNALHFLHKVYIIYFDIKII